MHYKKEEVPLHQYGDRIGGSGFHSVRAGEHLDMGWWKLPPHESDYRGLPDSICPCPHYGFVVSGRLRVKYPDEGTEEIIEAGDVYYIPPRHVYVIEEETECVEFSPSEQLDVIMERINENARTYGYPAGDTAER